MQWNKGIVIVMVDGGVLVAPRRPSRSTTVPSATTSNKLYRVGGVLCYSVFMRVV